MKYEVHISGNPSTRRGERVDRAPQPPRNRPPQPPPEARMSGVALHRFPPIIQVLTQVSPQIQQRLQAIGTQAFQQGKNLEQICQDIYNFVNTLGYEATLGVQEVYSASMPSFPGQTVTSALIMMDIYAVDQQHASPKQYVRAS